MPKGVYKHKKGYYLPIEVGEKISEGKKGKSNGRLGFHHSEETKLKISLAHKGIKNSEKHKNNMSLARKGVPWSEARRKAQEFVTRTIQQFQKPVIKNGKEYDPNWHEIRKEIYKRDNWLCQECLKKCHGIDTKNKIQCHHIDFNEKNNESNNLITLCVSCHAKIRFKGKDWIKYYQNKMKER